MIITSIKDLKKLVLTTKKDSKELSKAYGSILKQVENMTIGVANPETDEKKLIVTACKKELKEQEQSRDCVPSAPFSIETIDLCKEILSAMTPKLMTERETEIAIDSVVQDLENPNMGQIMGAMKSQYGEMLDMALLSKLVKQKLSK